MAGSIEQQENCGRPLKNQIYTFIFVNGCFCTEIWPPKNIRNIEKFRPLALELVLFKLRIHSFAVRKEKLQLYRNIYVVIFNPFGSGESANNRSEGIEKQRLQPVC